MATIKKKNEDGALKNALLKYDGTSHQPTVTPVSHRIGTVSDAVRDIAKTVSKHITSPVGAGNSATSANGAYSSPYTGMLTKTMNDITNREPFQFDLNGDALYQQYRQRYLRDAQLAAQDTLGMTTALTGGYANSYAQSAAQQQYQNQIAKLNDVVPEIYQLQRGAYDADTDRLYQQYNMYANADDRLYGRYRDTVSDERYNKEWDYNVAQDERNWNYQLEQDAKQDDLNRANVLMSTGQYDAAGKILGIDLSGYQSEQDKKKALDDEFERQQREWTLKGYEQDYNAGEISNNSAKLNYALQMAEIGNYKPLQELGISPEQYQSYLAAAATSSGGGSVKKGSGGGGEGGDVTAKSYSIKTAGKSVIDGQYSTDVNKMLNTLYDENYGNLIPQGSDANGNVIAKDRSTGVQYVINYNAKKGTMTIYEKSTMKDVTDEFIG